MNNAQPITRNIRKPGDVSNLKFCTYTQNRNGLIGLSFEIPAYAYCKRYGQFKKQKMSKATDLIGIERKDRICFIDRMLKYGRN